MDSAGWTPEALWPPTAETQGTLRKQSRKEQPRLLDWLIDLAGWTPAVRGDPSVETHDRLRKTIKQRTAPYLIGWSIQLLRQCEQIHLLRHKTGYERLSSKEQLLTWLADRFNCSGSARRSICWGTRQVTKDYQAKNSCLLDWLIDSTGWTPAALWLPSAETQGTLRKQSRKEQPRLLDWLIDLAGWTPAVRGDPSVETQDWLRKTLKQRTAAYLIGWSIQLLRQCEEIHLLRHKTGYERLWSKEQLLTWLVDRFSWLNSSSATCMTSICQNTWYVTKTIKKRTAALTWLVGRFRWLNSSSATISICRNRRHVTKTIKKRIAAYLVGWSIRCRCRCRCCCCCWNRKRAVCLVDGHR